MAQPPEQPEQPGERPRRGERTRGDLSILLVELMRATKGLRFYGARHPSRRDLLDRSFLAWQADLQRAGDVDLQTDEREFRCAGVLEAVPHGHLAELAATLRARGCTRVRIHDDVSREAFHAFVELLSLNEDALRNRGGFASALAERAGRAIELEGACPEPEDELDDTAPILAPLVAAARQPGALAQAEPLQATPAAREAAPEERRPVAPDPDPAEDETAPELEPFADEDAPRPREPEREAARATTAPGPAPAPEPVDPASSNGTSLGSALLRPSAKQVEAFESRTQATLEESPLDAFGEDERDEAIRLALRDLQRARDDGAYARLAAEIAAQAAAFGDAGVERAAYRAMLVFADHAVGLDGRSAAQVREAQQALESLTVGQRLECAIDRACEVDPTVAIRAAQVLLQVGGRVVGALLDRLEKESDPDRVAQLRGAVIALGERGVPMLVAAIKQGSRERARVAIRIAGELQSRHLVPTLAGAIREGSPDLSREAARALAHIRGTAAIEAIEEALSSLDPGVREVAVSALGAVGGPDAARVLLGVLDGTTSGGVSSPALVRAAIRELAAIGSEAAVPKLVSILERRSLFRRKDQRELKLAALGALAKLEGGEARRAILRALRSRDPEVRRRAQQIAEHAKRAATAERATETRGATS